MTDAFNSEKEHPRASSNHFLVYKGARAGGQLTLPSHGRAVVVGGLLKENNVMLLLLEAPQPNWAEIVSAISSSVLGLATLLVVWVSMLVAARSTRATVLLDCHRRYDELVAIRDPEREPEWFVMFWEGQRRQFDHWRRSEIDHDTFREWMQARHYDWGKEKRKSVHADLAANPKTFMAGWASYKEHTDEKDPFVKFINKALAEDKLDEALEETTPRGVKVTVKRSLGLIV